MFWRKRTDKSNPTQDEEKKLSKEKEKHRGASEINSGGFDKKTLDDIGMPPPPPSFDNNQDMDQTSQESRNEIDEKNPELVPFNAHVHDTIEPELPKDYEKRINKLDKELHIVNKKHAKKIEAQARRDLLEETSDKKIILKDLSKETLKRVDKYEKKIDVIENKTKDSIKNFKEKITKKICDSEKSIKESIKESNELSKENKLLKKQNQDLVKEKKELVSKFEDLMNKYEKINDEQKENNAFIDKFRKYMDPLVEREKKLIATASKTSKESALLHSKFKELMKTTQKVNSQFSLVAKEQKTLHNEIAEMNFHIKDIPLLQENVITIKDKFQQTKNEIKEFTKGHVDKKVNVHEIIIRDLSSSLSNIKKDNEKLKDKLDIVRDKLNYHIKRKHKD